MPSDWLQSTDDFSAALHDVLASCVFVRVYGSLEVEVCRFGDKSWQGFLSRRGEIYCRQVDKQFDVRRLLLECRAAKPHLKIYLPLPLPSQKIDSSGEASWWFIPHSDRSKPTSMGCLNGSVGDRRPSLTTLLTTGSEYGYDAICLIRTCLYQGSICEAVFIETLLGRVCVLNLLWTEGVDFGALTWKKVISPTN